MSDINIYVAGRLQDDFARTVEICTKIEKVFAIMFQGIYIFKEN